MDKKVLAIVGSYRKNGITDQIVDAVLNAAKQNGAETEKIYLTDKHIEFCVNCRKCCATSPGERRGQCVLKDDVEELLDKIDSADGIVLASPINFYTVTAVMKKFIERLIVYAYWPWGQDAPKDRVKSMMKRAVVVTSSACPAFIGRIVMPNAARILKVSAKIVGAKVVRSVYFGMVAVRENQELSMHQVKVAWQAGQLL